MTVEAYCQPCNDLVSWEQLIDGVWTPMPGQFDLVSQNPDTWEFNPQSQQSLASEVTFRYCCPDECSTTTMNISRSQKSAVQLSKTGTLNGNGDVGDTIDYTFSVVNSGLIDLTGLTISDPMITVTGGPIDLPVNTSDNTTFTGSYTITQQDVDNGSVSNTATITGQDGNGESVDDQSSNQVALNSSTGAISLEKSGALNGTGSVGDTIDYTFTVTNTGQIDVNNILISDPLITVTGGPINLTPSSSDATTFTGSYTLTQADLNAGQVTNQATASGTDTNNNTVNAVSDDPSLGGITDPTVVPLPSQVCISEPSTVTPITITVQEGQVINTGASCSTCPQQVFLVWQKFNGIGYQGGQGNLDGMVATAAMNGDCWRYGCFDNQGNGSWTDPDADGSKCITLNVVP